METQFVTLEITNMQYSAGGEHYYGKLTAYGNRYSPSHFKNMDIKRKLTDKKEVKYLNQKDGSFIGGGKTYFRWKIGDKTNRFEIEEDIQKVALEIWKKEYPECDYLILGRSAVAEPQLILDGKDESLMKTANEIFQEFEKLAEYWDCDDNEKKMDILSKKWFKLFGKVWK